MSDDRMVHAINVNVTGDAAVTTVVARYDRQGRWYRESSDGTRERLPTVHDAAQAALDLEEAGGEILSDRPGGKQFDTKVAGARQRQTRGVRR